MEPGIAKHIPTKRELKQFMHQDTTPAELAYCKAHPDEKGIETFKREAYELIGRNCKAHPDEKGIETLN